MCSETSQKQIIVIDDSAQVCSTLARFLRAEGYQVVCFATGTEAIRALKQPMLPAPDGMLIDCFLPFLDGFTLARWIRSKPFLAQTMIVMLSPSGSTLHHLLSRLAGARETLWKTMPLTMETLHLLLEVLERLL